MNRHDPIARYAEQQSAHAGTAHGSDSGVVPVQDLRLQRRFWIAQRLGWLVIALVLLAGAAGVLGGTGALGRTRIEADGVVLEHPRFARYLAPIELGITLRDVAQTPVRIGIGRAFSTRFVPYAIDPQPESQRAGAETTEYEFQLEPGTGRVVFTGRLRAVGPLSASLQVGAREPLSFRIWVYP